VKLQQRDDLSKKKINLKKTGKNLRKKCTERKGLIIFFSNRTINAEKTQTQTCVAKGQGGDPRHCSNWKGIIADSGERFAYAGRRPNHHRRLLIYLPEVLGTRYKTISLTLARNDKYFFLSIFFWWSFFTFFLYHFRFFLCSILFKFLADLVVWSFVLRRFCTETKDARRLRVSRGIDRKDRAWEHPRRTRRIVSLLICLDIGLRIEKARQWVGNGWRY